ncbi:sensor histidine kinase [Peptoniphilus stercorisuis]|uniref:histidine kinase n=1 Tax=Peptoniphilus stercorisuis TaxID=1436965 RepID=A0ABS4KB21_9FIRM|nr:HAMP domain-containing sensor histidine kinase [Peptoniphilus stercorisuis]MBP2024974.1 signal transduction histidine kinase [Peptoniphilus stercorisuis]
MKKSIGKRLVKSFLLIIIITVTIIGAFLVFGFKQFYYNTIENELENRLIVSMDSYNKFYSDKTIEELLIEDTDLLWGHISAEVQVLDPEGYVLMDTIGAISDEPVETSDLTSARSGSLASWVGNSKYADEMIMAITGPLRNNRGDTIGYLRFISSMDEANSAILKTSLTILLLSFLVILVTTFVSFLLANSIVKPIKELTTVANKMADGQYKVRSTVNTDDELGQLSATLNTMAEEILKKEQIKNDFISSISHELRTPLTSIKGWAVVLKSAKEDEKELLEDGLTIIENESDRLAKMVEELLDFSRYISGRIQLEKDTFNIVDICNDVAKQMKPRAESNKVDFHIEIEDTKELIIGDENRIRQLLINLLDNAIKFTSEKGWVKFTAHNEDGQFVMLVSDNGLGISKEELSHVKEKFYKGKHSNSHSGLGLSISDEIAKLHGGNLEIFSEENIGTTVKVTIPVITEVEEL